MRTAFLLTFLLFAGLTLRAVDPVLDPAFDADGILSVSGRPPRGSVLQQDGKLVFATSEEPSMSVPPQIVRLYRYLPNGSPDPTYGPAGLQVLTFPFGVGFQLYGLAIDHATGRFLIVGSYYNGTRRVFCLVSVLSDGSLDTSFGDGGYAFTDFGESAMPAAITVHADRRITILGYVQHVLVPGQSSDRNIAVARYLPTGLPDPTLNGTGMVTFDFGAREDWPTGLAIQPDGKTIIAGRSYLAGGTEDFTIARLETDGSLDASFGVGGIVRTDFLNSYDSAESVILLSGGEILVAGSAESGPRKGAPPYSPPMPNAAFVRYSANGTVLTKMRNSFATEALVATSLPDGRILLGGAAWSSRGLKVFAVARFHRDGSLDPSFQNAGVAKVELEHPNQLYRLTGIHALDGGKSLLLGCADFAQHVAFQFLESSTPQPALLSPASATFLQGSTIGVAFQLPEQAKPNTLALSFEREGGETRAFTLDGSLEGAGLHQFSFAAANPAACPLIVAGAQPLADGKYTTKLSYENLEGVRKESVRGGVIIDLNPPVIAPIADIFHEAIDPSGYPVEAPTITADAGATVTLTPSLPRTFPIGTTEVTARAVDQAGNETVRSFQVIITSPLAFHNVVIESRGEVGDWLHEEIGSTLWRNLRFQTLANDGSVTFMGDWRGPVGAFTGLFRDGYRNSSIERLKTESRLAAGVRFRQINCAISAEKATLIKGTLAGTGVTPGSDSVIVLADFNSMEDFDARAVLSIVAREGDPAPGVNGRFRSFANIALSQTGRTIAIEGTAGNSQKGVWIKSPETPLVLAVQAGWTLPIGANARILRSFVTLRSGDASPGHGTNLLTETSSGAELVVSASFHDRSRALLIFATDNRFPSPTPSGGSFTVLDQSAEKSTIAPAGASFTSFRTPASTLDGSHLAFQAVTLDSMSRKPRAGIFLQDRGGAPDMVARSGDDAPGIEGTQFHAFSDPAISADAVMFRATLTGGGIGAANRYSLWLTGQDGNPAILAQSGQTAAGCDDGARWKSFTSLALPDLDDELPRPLFTASLIRGGSTNASNDAGIWVTDSKGVLQLLVRKGQQFEGRKLVGFQILRAVPGALGSAHSYNNRGELLWRAEFEGRNFALVRTLIQ